MKKIMIVMVGAVLLFGSVGIAFASEGDAIARGKALVDSGASCAELSQDDLEVIGDYYMEQMHPGALHEQMDALMGGEGSESLRQMHILIARRWQCGDAIGMGMMGMMMGPSWHRADWNRATTSWGNDWGMMGGWNGVTPGIGMMGWGNGWTGGWSILGWVTTALVWVLLILGIIALVRWIGKKK